MPRSSIERRLYCLVFLLLAFLGAPVVWAQFSLSTPSRLLSVIDVSEREDQDQADVTIIFNCSMRFVTSVPANEGKQVHLQVAPLADCGVSPLTQIAPEIPPLSGGRDIIGSARAESLAPGQITITIDFKKSERFVIAQGIDPRGLRLRLYRTLVARLRAALGDVPLYLCMEPAGVWERVMGDVPSDRALGLRLAAGAAW